MNVEELRDYCLSKNWTDESLPFDDQTLVLKVGGKMFAIIALEHSPTHINLKCDPNWSEELREKNDSIVPGYHSNKKHWNTVIVDGSISIELLKKMIDHSYELVYNGLPKKLKESLI